VSAVGYLVTWFREIGRAQVAGVQHCEVRWQRARAGSSFRTAVSSSGGTEASNLRAIDQHCFRRSVGLLQWMLPWQKYNQVHPHSSYRQPEVASNFDYRVAVTLMKGRLSP
jgi:peptidoglycan/xylan/chitin deacetylase (PgdA/CDA1 family)